MLPLSQLLPLNAVSPELKQSAKYKQIAKSVAEVGIIEPLVVARSSDQPAIMIHAVSVGEVNATRALVDALSRERPDVHVIISTTTQTGYDRGEQLFGRAKNVTLIRYPLDFTAAVTRVLDKLRPDLVVLMELEVWPNFVEQCIRRKIPIILANGRLTDRGV